MTRSYTHLEDFLAAKQHGLHASHLPWEIGCEYAKKDPPGQTHQAWTLFIPHPPSSTPQKTAQESLLYALSKRRITWRMQIANSMLRMLWELEAKEGGNIHTYPRESQVRDSGKKSTDKFHQFDPGWKYINFMGIVIFRTDEESWVEELGLWGEQMVFDLRKSREKICRKNCLDILFLQQLALRFSSSLTLTEIYSRSPVKWARKQLWQFKVMHTGRHLS